MDSKTKDILVYIANDDFVSANRGIDELEVMFNKSKIELPIHDCLRAALYYKMIEEYRTRQFEKEFKTAVKKAVKILKDEDKDKDKGKVFKAKRLQLLGSAYGYRGMYRSLKGLWGSAFVDGKRAHNVLKDSLELDSTLIDNHAGIGTYLYWRSKKAGFMKYLLFWGDKTEEGINEIKSSLNDYKVVRHWALGGLLRIYLEEKKWEEALKYADEILAEMPNDSGATGKKAFALEKLNKKKEALKLHKKLLLLFKSKSSFLNTANAQIEAIFHILKLSKELELKIDKSKYLSDVDKLSKQVTKSFHDIDDYIDDIKKF